MKRFIVAVFLGLIALVLSGCQLSTKAIDYKTVEEVGRFKNLKQLEQYLNDFTNDRNSQYVFGSLRGDVFISTQASMTDAVAEAGSQEKSHSETNDQVEGVGESDTILTDGDYIYMVSGNTLYVIDAETLAITDTFVVENGYFSGIYLYEGLLIAIGSERLDQDETQPDASRPEAGIDYYGYYYYSYGTSVRIFDITDRNEIVLNRELYFKDAYLTQSRMIDNHLYLVINDYSLSYGRSGEEILPQYQDSVVDDEFVRLPASDVYYMPSDPWQCSYLLLASLAVDGEEAADIKAYLGNTYQIYMSLNNLYAVVHRYWYTTAIWPMMMSETYIVRFGLVDNVLEYQATAVVEGAPLNQFSMDEYEGYFRIATTGNKFVPSTDADATSGSWTVSNQVTIFDATADGQVEPVSVLGNLGKPGERIYAVRFTGAIGYVVTFVNTDPLYKLDLSDPENPVVLGELYEEGVSDYLHDINDDLLLGVGRQAEVNDYGFTVFTGVKVALYDVSGDEPVNLETFLVPGEYSYTPVIYDHKAFVSYRPADAEFIYVAIPVTEYFQNWYRSLQSVYVFKVTFTGELEFLVNLSHMEEPTNHYYYYLDTVDRTLMIENMIYTISASQIRMYDMADEFAEVAAICLNCE